MDAVEFVSSWQVWALSVAIYAATGAIKSAIKILAPVFAEKPAGKALVAVQNVLLGALSGIPSWLPDGNMGERILAGVACGALASTAYSAVVKRFKEAKGDR